LDFLVFFWVGVGDLQREEDVNQRRVWKMSKNRASWKEEKGSELWWLELKMWNLLELIEERHSQTEETL